MHVWTMHIVKKVQPFLQSDGEFIVLEIPEDEQRTALGCEACGQSIYDVWGKPCKPKFRPCPPKIRTEPED